MRIGYYPLHAPPPYAGPCQALQSSTFHRDVRFKAPRACVEQAPTVETRALQENSEYCSIQQKRLCQEECGVVLSAVFSRLLWLTWNIFKLIHQRLLLVQAPPTTRSRSGTCALGRYSSLSAVTVLQLSVYRWVDSAGIEDIFNFSEAISKRILCCYEM